MDYQKQYYEIKDFWDGVPDQSDIERIKKISELIPTDVTSILDVGCGNGIFVNFLNEQPRKYSRLHGVDRSLTALSFVKTEKSQASIENLPFDTNEFDLITCLEVLEHLPQLVFQQALSELSRVSKKYIIVSVPNKQNLQYGQIYCPKCFTRFNPDLHLQSFKQKDLENLLDKYNFFCKYIEAFGDTENYIALSKILQWRSKYQWLQNRAFFDKLCPICGATIPKRESTAKENSKTFNKILKKAWPKTYRKRWLLALYEKS